MEDGSTPEPQSPVAAVVGQRVRELRTAAGLTVVDVARTSSVSRRMLTMIELGQANPSVLILDRIAAALGADLAALLLPTSAASDPADPSGSPVVFRAADTVDLVQLPGGGAARLHARTPTRHGPELWTWTLAPGDTLDVEATSERADLLFLVTAGRLHIRAADDSLTLDAGDSAWLTTNISHRYANDGPATCEFVQMSHSVRQ